MNLPRKLLLHIIKRYAFLICCVFTSLLKVCAFISVYCFKILCMNRYINGNDTIEVSKHLLFIILTIMVGVIWGNCGTRLYNITSELSSCSATLRGRLSELEKLRMTRFNDSWYYHYRFWSLDV